MVKVSVSSVGTQASTVGYYYNFDTKIFYIKSFETPNYQKENLENIKKYSSIITLKVTMMKMKRRCKKYF